MVARRSITRPASERGVLGLAEAGVGVEGDGKGNAQEWTPLSGDDLVGIGDVGKGE